MGIIVTGYMLRGLSLNLDFWETYWLARKRSANVFIYLSGRLAIRASTVWLTAFFTKDVSTIIVALLVVELVRLVGFGVLALNLSLLSGRTDPRSFAEQARFTIPMGVAGSSLMVNSYAGQAFVLITLGAATLAYYVAGSMRQ